MKEYLMIKRVKAKPMTRKEYNDLRRWIVPENENPNDEGFLIESEGNPNHPDYKGYLQWLTKEQFDMYYLEKSGLTFSTALEVLKLGKRIARASWNEGGYYSLAEAWYLPTWDDILAEDWKILD